MKIGLLLYPGCVVSGLFAFSELLQFANKRSGKNHFEITWVGVDNCDVEVTAGGNTPVARMSVENTVLDAELDALLIPGFWTDRQSQVQETLEHCTPIVQTLKELPSNTQVWGYCTAVCMMAASGRLKGQIATATWWLANFAQDNYTDVNWSFSQTFIAERYNITASGLNGYLPIAQMLIEKRCGNDVLKDIIDLMLVPKPDKSVQPFVQIKLMDMEDKLLRKIFVWVQQTPANQLTVASLAKSINQTERTLARKVKEATELSIASFMRIIKLHQASDLLVYSNLPINIISNNLGFSDDASFRRTFKKVSAYTPGEYRQTFKR